MCSSQHWLTPVCAASCWPSLRARLTARRVGLGSGLERADIKCLRCPLQQWEAWQSCQMTCQTYVHVENAGSGHQALPLWSQGTQAWVPWYESNCVTVTHKLRQKDFTAFVTHFFFTKRKQLRSKSESQMILSSYKSRSVWVCCPYHPVLYRDILQ